MVYQTDDGKWAYKCHCGKSLKGFASELAAQTLLRAHKVRCTA